MLRPIGSGLPLGFFSFAIGMLLLGCQAIGWIPISEPKDVGMLESFEGLEVQLERLESEPGVRSSSNQLLASAARAQALPRSRGSLAARSRAR